MTKQDILDYFSLIDFAYNESGRLESLSRMLDALLKEQEGIIDSLKSDLSKTLDVVTNRKNVVRCVDCVHDTETEWPYPCERHTDGGKPDDWFCADGVMKDD